MKKINIQLFIAVLLLIATTPAWPQEGKVMQVHSGGSVVYEVPTLQVDSITFSTNDPVPYDESFTGIWESNPEPGVTITLTINADQVYLNTSPQDLTTVTAYKYMLGDGQQYILSEDNKMYLILPEVPDPVNTGVVFNITKLSPDSLKLEYFGGIFFDTQFVMADFLFNRKMD